VDTLRETVVKGRMGQMPAFQDKLGDERVRLLAAYALKLSGGVQ
jgi:mono/diheme cytochrome c family protein